MFSSKCRPQLFLGCRQTAQCRLWPPSPPLPTTFLPQSLLNMESHLRFFIKQKIFIVSVGPPRPAKHNNLSFLHTIFGGEGSFSFLIIKSKAVSSLLIGQQCLVAQLSPRGPDDVKRLCSFSLLGSSQWQSTGFSAHSPAPN